MGPVLLWVRIFGLRPGTYSSYLQRQDISQKEMLKDMLELGPGQIIETEQKINT